MLLRKWLRIKFIAFISKKNLPSKQHLLTRKNLYIFPSRLGFFYLLFTLLLWLLGTNYQNNLLLALCYLQLCMMLVSIFHCYFNMLALKVQVLKSEPIFCEELALICLNLANTNKYYRQGLSIAFSGAEFTPVQWDSKQLTRATLVLKTNKRGLMQVPRVELRSYYPLGLLRCWSLLSLDEQVLVYPKAIPGIKQSIILNEEAAALSDRTHNRQSDDMELADLHRYVQGDSVNLIAWKQYARRGVLYKKHYQSHLQPCIDLKYSDYPAASNEQKLQHLCFAALQLEQTQEYSLQLPNVYLSPASGPAHLQAVLTALANFEDSDASVAGSGHG
jgi:uncharacterized protein (DUF58 family)